MADPTPPGEPDLDRLERYLAGALDESERATVASWIAADPARQVLLDALARLWEGRDPETPAFDSTTMWAHVRSRVRARRSSPPINLLRGERHPGRRRHWISTPLVASAGVIAILIWGAVVTHDRLLHPAAAPMREFSARRGERTDVQLDDGTRVILGAATTLRVPATFGAPARDVYLDGEAYFDVVHDAAHRFTVHTARATVEDLGTQFDVRAYADDRDVRIGVTEGRVGLALVGAGHKTIEDRFAPPAPAPAVPRPPDDTTHMTLSAGDVATVSDTVLAITHNANVAAATAWTNGRLSFDAAPLAQVLPALGRWYDLDFRLADPALGRQSLSVTFGGESVAQVLDAVALLTHSRYVQRGRVVEFTPLPAP